MRRSSLGSDREEDRRIEKVSKSTRFFILEDLEENSQYQVTLTPVWDREDFRTLLSGNVLTFSVASEEEVKCSHSMSVDTNNSLFLHTACFN